MSPFLGEGFDKQPGTMYQNKRQPRLDLGMTSDLRNHLIQTILVCLGNEKAFRINTEPR